MVKLLAYLQIDGKIVEHDVCPVNSADTSFNGFCFERVTPEVIPSGKRPNIHNYRSYKNGACIFYSKDDADAAIAYIMTNTEKLKGKVITSFKIKQV